VSRWGVLALSLDMMTWISFGVAIGSALRGESIVHTLSILALAGVLFRLRLFAVAAMKKEVDNNAG